MGENIEITIYKCGEYTKDKNIQYNKSIQKDVIKIFDFLSISSIVDIHCTCIGVHPRR